MPAILILYHSRTENTERMASAVAEGARSIQGVEVELKYHETAENLEIFDAIAIGTPTYYHAMTIDVKNLLEEAAGKDIENPLIDKLMKTHTLEEWKDIEREGKRVSHKYSETINILSLLADVGNEYFKLIEKEKEPKIALQEAIDTILRPRGADWPMHCILRDDRSVANVESLFSQERYSEFQAISWSQ